MNGSAAYLGSRRDGLLAQVQVKQRITQLRWHKGGRTVSVPRLWSLGLAQRVTTAEAAVMTCTHCDHTCVEFTGELLKYRWSAYWDGAQRSRHRCLSTRWHPSVTACEKAVDRCKGGVSCILVFGLPGTARTITRPTHPPTHLPACLNASPQQNAMMPCDPHLCLVTHACVQHRFPPHQAPPSPPTFSLLTLPIDRPLAKAWSSEPERRSNVMQAPLSTAAPPSVVEEAGICCGQKIRCICCRAGSDEWPPICGRGEPRRDTRNAHA